MFMTNLTSKKLEFEDHSEALEYYFEQGWTDGLPIVVPTPEKVNEFLEHSSLHASEIIGLEPVKGRVLTAEKIAINAVMAGCKPQYFPVVVAAISAITESQYNLHGISVSTYGAATLTVVGGPIVKELGLNSGVGVFGPGNRANSTIGRAIRLVISNVSGAVPGELDKGTLAHGGKYSWCIAEDSEINPWDSLDIDRGVKPHTNSVTVFAAAAPNQANNHSGDNPEDILMSIADAMLSAGPNQTEIIITLCPEHIGYISDHGWSKQQVKEFLHSHSHKTSSQWAEAGFIPSVPRNTDQRISVTQSPDSITILTAGGAAGGFSAVIPLWGAGLQSKSTTKSF
ncbi:MAG: hypothetical protein VX701_00770 [Chloroflexota bacterium]|nr:hypothetical protein [Chloroflexota bacterium]